MKIRLSDRALAYLKREQSYLARYDKRVALAVVRQIRAATKLIGEYPQIGPAVDGAEGVRRYISAPYQIDYQEDEVGLWWSQFATEDRPRERSRQNTLSSSSD